MATKRCAVNHENCKYSARLYLFLNNSVYLSIICINLLRPLNTETRLMAIQIYFEVCFMVFKVIQKISQVFSMFMVLRPWKTSESSVHRPYLNKHECRDTRDGNYSCSGSMNGMY